MESTISCGRSVRVWLWALFALVILMVILGGVTRLTGSGLSMTEWHPLMGAIPPLSEADWQEKFSLYQSSPQFQQVNHWMGLSEFKRIFLWEYVHRLAGRLLGVVFLLGFFWHLARRNLSRRWVALTLGGFVLGGLQGLLGWYMVKSGLTDDPRVSHFRLAAHLMLALVTAQYLAILALSFGIPGCTTNWRRRFGCAAPFLVILLLQITYGAFVAGLRGGQAAMTFPDMNGQFVPDGVFPEDMGPGAALHHPLTVHFIHRIGALVTLVLGVVLAWRARGLFFTCFAWGLMTLLLTQVGLGVATVLSGVGTLQASMHQVVGVLLLTWTTLGVAQSPQTSEESA